MKDQIQADVERALKALNGVEKVEIEWSAQVRSTLPALRKDSS